VQTPDEQNKAIKFDEIFVDTGYPVEKVRELVRIGDPVVMLAEPQILADGGMACKTMDDRASVAAMLVAAEELKRMKHKADVYFCCTSQEEVGYIGAITAGYSADPDMAIAIDVTHAHTPGTQPDDTHPLDTPCFTVGPNIHPKMFKMLMDEAKRINVKTEIASCGGETGTDAWALQVARAGVPTVLMELPLKYMHTTVELISLDVLREQARLLASFLASVGEDWEEKLCF
jgi:endoglucanase